MMGIFAPPPRLDPLMRRMLAEMHEIEAWAAQFPAPAPPRKRAVRRARRPDLVPIAGERTSGKATAIVNGGDPEAEEKAAMDRAIYGSKR